MLIEPFIFILRFVASAFVAVLLLRFYMQWIRAPFYNPFAKFAVAVTDFAVKPARRLIPGFMGMDWATLVLAWLTECAVLGIAFLLTGHLFGMGTANPIPGIALLALFELATSALWLVILLQILLTIVSFVNPYSPHMDFLTYLNEPMVRPIRRFMPNIGGIDLSPMVVVLVCLLLLNFLLPALAGVLLSLLR